MTEAMGVVLVEESAVAAEVARPLSARLDGRPVETVDSVADARDLLAGGRVGCVVCGRPAPEVTPAESVVELRAAAPTTPLVLFADAGTDVDAALDAGADDVVPGRGVGTDRAVRLLARRVAALLPDDGDDAAADAPDDGDAAASDAGVGDDAGCSVAAFRLLAGASADDLVAVFDGEQRHTFVAGAPAELDATALADRRVGEALDGAVATALDADYRAALDGEGRTRERFIAGRAYRVRTAPLRVGGRVAGGLARYRELGRERDPAAETDVQTKVERLHDIASELDALGSVGEICELAVDTADRVLEFDACGIAERSGDRIVPLAARASTVGFDVSPMTAGEGLVGRTIEEGRTFHVEDVAEHPEANPVDDELRSALSVPLDEGRVFQAVSKTAGAYTETDRELAELLCTHVEHAIARAEYETLLTRERDRFAALFENVPDAAVRYRLDDGVPHVESVNAAFARLFGYDPETVVGRSVPSLLVPDDAVDAAADVYRAVADGDRVEREVERLTADGEQPFLLRNVPLGDGETGYLIYTDIGELKERERLLQRKNERLERFTSIVSHDLRNPLAVASGYVEMALETGDVSHVEATAEELDRMERMVDELLTLAREGEIIGRTEPVDVGAAAEDAWGHVDTGAATLRLADPPTVDASRDRLVELFENCFRNAMEHATDSDGEDLTITVGGTAAGFYVADDGPGIPSDVADQVFEYGYSTAADGTGFGLAIVEEIAGAHGWTVEVADAADGGARLTFDFESGGG